MMSCNYTCDICKHDIKSMANTIALMGGRTGVDGPLQRSFEPDKKTAHTHLCRKCCRAISAEFKHIDSPRLDEDYVPEGR
jgi:hypothetical protein